LAGYNFTQFNKGKFNVIEETVKSEILTLSSFTNTDSATNLNTSIKLIGQSSSPTSASTDINVSVAYELKSITETRSLYRVDELTTIRIRAPSVTRSSAHINTGIDMSIGSVTDSQSGIILLASIGLAGTSQIPTRSLVDINIVDIAWLAGRSQTDTKSAAGITAIINLKDKTLTGTRSLNNISTLINLAGLTQTVTRSELIKIIVIPPIPLTPVELIGRMELITELLGLKEITIELIGEKKILIELTGKWGGEMAAENENLTLYVDSHKIIGSTVEDVEHLDGCFIKWKLSKARDQEEILLKTNDNATEITHDGNRFEIYLTPEDTKNLNPKYKYYHEARITDSHGQTTPVTSGEVKVVETLTSS